MGKDWSSPFIICWIQCPAKYWNYCTLHKSMLSLTPTVCLPRLSLVPDWQLSVSTFFLHWEWYLGNLESKLIMSLPSLASSICEHRMTLRDGAPSSLRLVHCEFTLVSAPTPPKATTLCPAFLTHPEMILSFKCRILAASRSVNPRFFFFFFWHAIDGRVSWCWVVSLYICFSVWPGRALYNYRFIYMRIAYLNIYIYIYRPMGFNKGNIYRIYYYYLSAVFRILVRNSPGRLQMG